MRGTLVRALVVETLAATWLAVSVIPCAAQATAQISGTVRDSSGAVLPGVTVTATQTETGFSRTTVTDAEGLYVVASLPLGPYNLEATLQGFRTSVQTGIVLQVNSSPVMNVTLQVGRVAETVTVQGQVPQVETRSVGISTVMAATSDLPLNARQSTDLITLSGLAVQTGTAPAYTMNTGVNISVAGSTSYSIQYNLDGASHLDVYTGTGMPLPFPDTLQEFRVVTGGQEASAGGHAGASVNAVTKSGTNQVRGDLFWFIRDSALNGKDPFQPRKDGLKRNQFGGVIGGPILTNKLFFFGGYQGTTTRQSPLPVQAFVPTAAMRTGDFSAYIANNCPGAASLGRGVLGPGIVANGRVLLPLSQAALNIASRLPQSTDPCGSVFTGNIVHENQFQVPLRIDYQVNTKNSLFARYLTTGINTTVPYELSPEDVLTVSGIGTDDLAQSLTGGFTTVLSTKVVNSFRVFRNWV
ncbi:MAG: carboxypeptidase-like regulatory domain-containing protein, partial [Vicinamibacterales bacterium]